MGLRDSKIPEPMGNSVKLSVVIPCYNGEDTISAQLSALAKQNWSESWEVIVADNGSTDQSREVVESFLGEFTNLRIVDASARKGQPYALNVGARSSNGEFLAFCDADDEVGTDWLPAMGKALSQHDFVACRFEGKKLNSVFVQNVHRDTQQDGLQEIWYSPFLPHAGGGSLGVKRALFDSIGGFDETLPFLHDTDFCFRAQLAGTNIHFVSDAVAHIRHRATLEGNYRRCRNFAQYNVLLSKRYNGFNGNALRLWGNYLWVWLRLVGALPRIRNEKARFEWVRCYGQQIGRLRGILLYRAHPV